MAKKIYSDIADYKDVNEFMQNPVYGLMGNRYTYSASVSLNYEMYVQTQLLRFNDDINYSFSATYVLSNSTLTGMLGGDFGLGNNIDLTYNCYEQNGKIFVGDKELTSIRYDDNGIVVSFIYDGNLYELVA